MDQEVENIVVKSKDYPGHSVVIRPDGIWLSKDDKYCTVNLAQDGIPCVTVGSDKEPEKGPSFTIYLSNDQPCVQVMQPGCEAIHLTYDELRKLV